MSRRKQNGMQRAIRTNTKAQWILSAYQRTIVPRGREGMPSGQEVPPMLNFPSVAVVDDDESVREALPDLLKEFGFQSMSFSSAEDFLASEYLDEFGCLIADVVMPGMSGPELQRELKSRGQRIPIIFITAVRDNNVRPLVLEQGAVECLYKPFSDVSLLGALNRALPKI